jgi:hypothetical protein
MNRLHWNYRLIRYPDGDGSLLQLSEVYWEGGKPVGYIEKPAICGNDQAEVERVMDMIRDALFNPVIDVSDLTSEPEGQS